jgi:predicted CXXCH cytochrome family protein
MEKKSRRAVFALLPAACLLFAVVVFANNTDLSKEAAGCLSCHARRGAVLTFRNNERMDVFVDPKVFGASVHHALPCSGCHSDFSANRHPKRTFRSREQYGIKAALACKRCHRDEQLRARSIHAALLQEAREGKPMTCTNCHGSHEIRRVTGDRKFASEEEYCMKCHGRPVRLVFRNGETLSAAVRISSLQRSVHGALSCSDCHYGFSPEEHPKRTFESRRDHTLALSDNCRRCHFDKYTKRLESIHYTMLSRGNTKAPVCIDCHGAHAIAHIAKERTLIASRCRQCHPAIYDIYAKSVHGKALFAENNQDVPVCTDCHTAHTIENPLSVDYNERIPEMCGNCHADKSVVGKYGLSTAVLESYLSDFHGATLKLYRLQKKRPDKTERPLVVCTDCHGTHDITSTVEPNAGVIKANLVKRCRSCHPGASKNFPDAWLSHYEPTFTRAPLVFLVVLAYKIFIPVLVVGLALQILLHIWRYVVSR